MKPTLVLLSAALCGISHASDFHPASFCDCLPEFDCASTPHPAPISIMGDHLHREGQWMISLRQQARSTSLLPLHMSHTVPLTELT